MAVPRCRAAPRTSPLAATRARTLVLQGFTEADLARLVGEAEPPPGMEPRSTLYTIDWIIWHIIEHEATHVGQVANCCAAWPRHPPHSTPTN